MVRTIYSWKDVVECVKKENPQIISKSLKFKYLAADLAEKVFLAAPEVANLANYLGLKYYPRPHGLPVDWEVTICKNYLAQRYTNPLDPLEYLIVIPPDSCGKLPYILHHTSTGWADARWFYEIVPELETIVKDPTMGLPFKVKFNETINQMFSIYRDGKGMSSGQIHSINLFFGKYVPSLEGLCSSCYRVMLPNSGAGERWVKQANGALYEIRLSAAKPVGLPAQRTEYVSQTIIDQEGNSIYAMWDPKNCTVSYTDIMSQGPTHIPWSLYDYNKFSIGIPPCLCKRTIG